MLTKSKNTMENEATEIAKKLVTDFITAMNNWEKQCRIIEKGEHKFRRTTS